MVQLSLSPVLAKIGFLGLTVFVMCATETACGQSAVLQGRMTDATSGQLLPHALVFSLLYDEHSSSL